MEIECYFPFFLNNCILSHLPSVCAEVKTGCQISLKAHLTYGFMSKLGLGLRLLYPVGETNLVT